MFCQYEKVQALPFSHLPSAGECDKKTRQHSAGKHMTLGLGLCFFMFCFVLTKKWDSTLKTTLKSVALKWYICFHRLPWQLSLTFRGKMCA